jgi:hypothetical protein
MGGNDWAWRGGEAKGKANTSKQRFKVMKKSRKTKDQSIVGTTA